MYAGTPTPTRPRTPTRAGARWAAQTAAAALTLGAMAGCASDRNAVNATNAPAPGSSITLPTPDPSTGATASGTGTGFDVLANMPDAAKEHTNAGAQAFARYYIEAYGRLLMDPAKGQLSKLYLPQCTECQVSESNIANCVDDGRRWTDLYYRTVSVSEPDVNGASVDASTIADVHLTSILTNSPVVVRTPRGSATTHPKSSDLLIQLRMTWRDGRWYIADFKDQRFTPASS